MTLSLTVLSKAFLPVEEMVVGASPAVRCTKGKSETARRQ